MRRWHGAATALMVFLALTLLGGLSFPAPPSPEETFPTSLHSLRLGKVTWYSKAKGGFEAITNIPIKNLECLTCHPGTKADGTPIDPARYVPDCTDCHAKPGDKVADATCLKCHRRQALEIGLGYSDVHRAKGLRCMDCHTTREMHGDGKKYASWLAPGAMDAACENCHRTLARNPAHDIHAATVHCTSCHAQSVISCYSCHFESEVEGKIKRAHTTLRDFLLLVRRQGTGKVYSGTLMTLTYQGKSFLAIAPYRAHTITRTGRACTDCHQNATIMEYAKTGKIRLTSWDASKRTIVITKGVIPVPPDWQKAFQLDFPNYTGDPKVAQTDPTKWVFLKSGADATQMLYADPLTKEQIEKLKRLGVKK
ncbi:MAG: hypothetical protein QN198_09615 [Armatimonadota bacterium]|nr:hypothetical protein [Armatimonadota bacterium]MDR5703844.1 hypothetical protein [Armatimonadota bacterium]